MGEFPRKLRKSNHPASIEIIVVGWDTFQRGGGKKKMWTKLWGLQGQNATRYVTGIDLSEVGQSRVFKTRIKTYRGGVNRGTKELDPAGMGSD